MLKRAQAELWLERERRAVAEREVLRAQRARDELVAQERAKKAQVLAAAETRAKWLEALNK